jgi:hypothetical protein
MVHYIHDMPMYAMLVLGGGGGQHFTDIHAFSLTNVARLRGGGGF